MDFVFTDLYSSSKVELTPCSRLLLEKLTVAQLVTNSATLMKPEGSLPCSQKPASSNCMVASSSWGVQLQTRNSQPFMEPRGSFLCSQEPIIGPHPEPNFTEFTTFDPISVISILVLSFHLCPGFPSGLFPQNKRTHFTNIQNKWNKSTVWYIMMFRNIEMAL
jgi:hypothetical protein